MFIITQTCGNVIAAKNEKNKASKKYLFLKTIYKSEIPANEISQYKNADLKYFLKFSNETEPYKKLI
jgi:hypothetical protein